MLFADYGEPVSGPAQPGWGKVDPISRRQPNGMLVYEKDPAAFSPMLPGNYAPIQISTTSTESRAPKSATAPTNGMGQTISTKSTTVPTSYQQTTQLPASRPATSTPTGYTMPTPKPAPTASSTPPYNPPPAPMPAPGAPRPAATTSPTPKPDIYFPPGVYDDVGTVLQPKSSKTIWYVAGGLGLAAIVGGVFLLRRR